MKKILLAFGTRPEAIKMCPVIKELQNRDSLDTVVCVTGQHKEMLEQVLNVFNVVPDYNLEIMKKNQDLFDITEAIINRMKDILIIEKPDLVLVHGDTSTTFAVALSCYYLHIPIGHVEAGLRTYNLDSPFPEEFNRQVTGIIARYHFAPTERAKENLLKEGKDSKQIFVTGNTVIDALKTTVRTDYIHDEIAWARDSRMIILTAHRRENIGQPMRQIFMAIRSVVEEHTDIKLIYPAHKNPKVQELAYELLGNHERIHIIEPLDVIDFHNFVANAYLVLTDSGGIQEEAPAFGVPVLVMRDTTERPEGIEAGTLKLVGTTKKSVYEAFSELLNNKKLYETMSKAVNPYGDGWASVRIADIIEKG